jgi:uncharacterized protein
MHLHPFVEIQKYGLNSLIRNNAQRNEWLIISDPTHPLYGIEKKEDILDRFELLAEKDRHTFIKAEYVSSLPFNRNQILKDIYQQVDLDDRFELMIFPTLNCNCACGYCYQQHNNQPRMTDKAYTAIYSLIQNKIAKGVRHISINLMGGEPTLETAKIIPFLERCRELCLESEVTFFSSLTSNGILMDPVRLFSAGISHFQVTLDGVPDIHESLRPAANGKPTYQRIVNNLLRIKNEKINASCTIRTNHTTASVAPENLDRFLEHLSQHFGGDNRFVMDHTFASDLGGDNDTSMLIPHDQRKDILESIYALTHNYGLATRVSRYFPNGGVCYAARSNHVTIMPDLRVLKCSVALDDTVNMVGRLLPDGELRLNENFEQWVSDPLTDPKCQECCTAPICQARLCPLDRIKNGKRHCHKMPSASYFFQEGAIRQANLKMVS